MAASWYLPSTSIPQLEIDSATRSEVVDRLRPWIKAGVRLVGTTAKKHRNALPKEVGAKHAWAIHEGRKAYGTRNFVEAPSIVATWFGDVAHRGVVRVRPGHAAPAI